ncbi:hypothetical protein ACX9NE_13575 [Mycobacterium sp. ML4]
MLLLADRNFAAADLIGQVAATGADLLFRGKISRKLPVIGHCGDGSWLSRIGTTTGRVIDAQIVVRLAGGPRRSERYLLITTLIDHRAIPHYRTAHPLPPTLGDRNVLPGTEIHHPWR